jgi:putative hydrolase of the HAD superfamily
MKLPHSIRAVSFDVGGTLIEPYPSVGHIYAEVALESRLPHFDPELLNGRFEAAWNNRGNFNYSLQSWAQLVAGTFGGDAAAFGASTRFFQRLYGRFSEPGAWHVYDDVIPALEALSKSGLKLAVVSNWDDRLRLLLRNLNLDRFFHSIEVSVESGFHKPAPEIFQRAVRSLSMPPDAVLHVGDSVLEDVEGAERAGLHPLLIRRKAGNQQSKSISSLTQLAAMFGSR